MVVPVDLDAGPSPDVARRVGIGLAYLIVGSRVWVHRRVERVTFLDEATVRRQTSVDFTYPIGVRAIERMLAEVATPLAPLALLDKEPLTNFSLRDEESRAIPMLTSAQNGDLAANVLTAYARTLLLGAGAQLSPAFEVGLQNIARRPTTEAWFYVHVLRRLRNLPNRPAARVRVQEVINLVQPPPDLAEQARGLAEHHRVADRLLASRPFTLLVHELARQFLMLVPLTDFRRRRVLKFTYDEDLDYRAGRDLIPRSARRALELVSLTGRTYQFASPVAYSASFHTEVVAPPDIEIVRSELLAQHSRLPQRVEEDAGRKVSEMASLQLKDIPRDWAGGTWVTFQATPAGLLRAAWLLAVLVSATLGIGMTRVSEIEAEAGAALLLAVPTALAAIIVRPGEHSLSTQLLLGVRALVLVVGMASFAAAGALAGGWKGDARADIWTWCFVVSLIPSALLSLAIGSTLIRTHLSGR